MDWRKKYEKIISSTDYVGCIFLPAGESRSCWESAPYSGDRRAKKEMIFIIVIPWAVCA